MQQTQKQKSNKNKTVFKRYINYIPVAFRKLIQIKPQCIHLFNLTHTSQFSGWVQFIS